MKSRRLSLALIIILLISLSSCGKKDPLQTWNELDSIQKDAIITEYLEENPEAVNPFLVVHPEAVDTFLDSNDEYLTEYVNKDPEKINLMLSNGQSQTSPTDKSEQLKERLEQERPPEKGNPILAVIPIILVLCGGVFFALKYVFSKQKKAKAAAMAEKKLKESCNTLDSSAPDYSPYTHDTSTSAYPSQHSTVENNPMPTATSIHRTAGKPNTPTRAYSKRDRYSAPSVRKSTPANHLSVSSKNTSGNIVAYLNVSTKTSDARRYGYDEEFRFDLENKITSELGKRCAYVLYDNHTVGLNEDYYTRYGGRSADNSIVWDTLFTSFLIDEVFVLQSGTNRAVLGKSVVNGRQIDFEQSTPALITEYGEISKKGILVIR